MLAELREHSPVFYAADLGMWVISRHHDVEEVFRDADTFSAAIAQDPIFPLHPERLSRKFSQRDSLGAFREAM